MTDLLSFLPHWSYIILLLALGIASYTDLTRQKIYNWLNFPTLVLGMIFSVTNGLGFFNSFLGFLIAFGIAFVLYISKGIYGGDVKLIAAIGAWVGMKLVLNTIAWIFICGGVLSILATIKNGTFTITMQKVGRFFMALVVKGMKPQAELEETVNKYVPYGIAIALGTILSLYYPDLLSFKQ